MLLILFLFFRLRVRSSLNLISFELENTFRRDLYFQGEFLMQIFIKSFLAIDRRKAKGKVLNDEVLLSKHPNHL